MNAAGEDRKGGPLSQGMALCCAISLPSRTQKTPCLNQENVQHRMTDLCASGLLLLEIRLSAVIVSHYFFSPTFTFSPRSKRMFHRFLPRKSPHQVLSAFSLVPHYSLPNHFRVNYSTNIEEANDQYENLTKSQIKLVKALKSEFSNHPRAEESIGLVTEDRIQNKDVLRRYLLSGKLELPTEDEIREQVQHALHLTQEKRQIYQMVRDALGWAEFNLLRSVVDEELTAWETNPKSNPTADLDDENATDVNQSKHTHASLKNVQISDKFQQVRLLPSMINSPHHLEAARRATQGKTVTRFPPEPNGFLHLGHAKAMQLSFSVADQEGGYTILRMDDTNPANEQQIYIDSIIDTVHWLGYRPKMITHASDYFPEMYDLACQLIDKGLAYVDFQDQKTILNQREHSIDSPFRNMPPAEAREHFEKMRNGAYDEGEAVLRLKGDMHHPLFVMRDMIAYRIKKHPHPRTGDKWIIYPTYDFTHCICDSLEFISYSLCTLEFENRRDSYYWLLEALDLYRPHVWEFSRLNLTNSIVSKRKVQKLINQQIVRGWDDPRIITLEALKRRGYTPESVRKFCEEIGVTRSAQQISLKLLEHICRSDLDERAERRFAVLKPLRVVVDNFDQVVQQLSSGAELHKDAFTDIEAVSASCINMRLPNHPRDTARGKRIAPLTKTLYIEADDFREEDSPQFYGLAPGKLVHLRYAFHIRCTHVDRDPTTNQPTTLHVQMEVDSTEKCKGNIHWISQNAEGQDPPRAEVRLYDQLFMSENVPMESEQATLGDVNPESEIVVSDAMLDWTLQGEQSLDVYTKYQFERLGFFSVDPDTNPEQNRVVFNRVVALRESKVRAMLMREDGNVRRS